MREIRSLRAMWRALETGSSLKIYAPALDPAGISFLEGALMYGVKEKGAKNDALR